MAYLIHSLASATVTHSFIALNGPILLAHESTQIIARANVAGVDTIVYPVKGRPFQLVSVASCTSESDAIGRYKSYCDMVAAGLLTLKRNSIDYFATYGQKAKVLDVAILESQITRNLVGNVTTGDTHLLTCQWSLLMEVA